MTENDGRSSIQWPHDKIAEWLAMDAEPLRTSYGDTRVRSVYRWSHPYVVYTSCDDGSNVIKIITKVAPWRTPLEAKMTGVSHKKQVSYEDTAPNIISEVRDHPNLDRFDPEEACRHYIVFDGALPDASYGPPPPVEYARGEIEANARENLPTGTRVIINAYKRDYDCETIAGWTYIPEYADDEKWGRVSTYTDGCYKFVVG